MGSRRVVATVCLAIAALISCNRDPNVAKQRYLASGNKYYEKGRFKEARIQYMNALSKDMRFGPAYYGRGMAEYRLGSLVPALQSFRRAVELIPPDRTEHWDSVVKAAEILLLAGRDKQELMDEAKTYCQLLLKHDPNSYDGHRLIGDWNFATGVEAIKVAQKELGNERLDAALVEYRKANAIKPGQSGVQLQLARGLAMKADFAGSEQAYRQVIAADKSSQVPYTELYKLFLFQKKVHEGEELLKQALQDSPKQYGYLTMLALHYSMEKRRPEMEAVLQQIKSHAGEFPEAYTIVGEFYQRMGEGDTAIKEFKDGIAHDPKKKVIYEKHIIEVLMRMGKKDEAAELNSSILKTDPNDPDARALAASFLLDKGEINRAVLELQAVITKAPDNAVAHHNLGRAHAAQGQWDQARQSYQKAIELRPDYLLPRLALSGLQMSQGEYDNALKSAQAILAIDRGNLNAMMIQTASMMGQKRYADARTRLTAMMEVFPNSPDVYFQMGVLNLAEGKYKDAEGSFRKGYDLNPANSRGLVGIVQTYMAQNRPEDALRLLQAEVEKSPGRLEFRVALAKTAAQLGKFDQAITEFQNVVNAMDKNNAERGGIYLQIGEMYRRKGDDVSAIAAFEKARESMPESGTLLTTLGLTFEHAGRTTEAKQIYEAAVKLEPTNGVALNNLAFLLAEHNGDLDDALTKGTRAKQLMPNRAEISDTLGWIYMKKNLSEDAIRIFQELVNSQPNQSTYRFHLAMALRQKGDKPRALKECQEALRNNPTSDERQKIQELLTKLNGT